MPFSETSASEGRIGVAARPPLGKSHLLWPPLEGQGMRRRLHRAMVEVARGREARHVEIEDARVDAGRALEREQGGGQGQQPSPPRRRLRPARSEVVTCSRAELALSDDWNRLDRGWRSAAALDPRAPRCRLQPFRESRAIEARGVPEPRRTRDQFFRESILAAPRAGRGGRFVTALWPLTPGAGRRGTRLRRLARVRRLAGVRGLAGVRRLAGMRGSPGCGGTLGVSPPPQPCGTHSVQQAPLLTGVSGPPGEQGRASCGALAPAAAVPRARRDEDGARRADRIGRHANVVTPGRRRRRRGRRRARRAARLTRKRSDAARISRVAGRTGVAGVDPGPPGSAGGWAGRGCRGRPGAARISRRAGRAGIARADPVQPGVAGSQGGGASGPPGEGAVQLGSAGPQVCGGEGQFGPVQTSTGIGLPGVPGVPGSQTSCNTAPGTRDRARIHRAAAARGRLRSRR